jgi:hypothetical protein
MTTAAMEALAPLITRRKGTGCDLLYLHDQERPAVPLVGCERRLAPAGTLPWRPCYRLDEGGLLLVAVSPAPSPDGRPWEERRLWRVL